MQKKICLEERDLIAIAVTAAVVVSRRVTFTSKMIKIEI